MKVTIKLFAGLQKGRFAVSERDFTEEQTVKDVMAAIGLPEKEAAVIFINNRHALTDQVLRHNDVLSIFPPLGGG